ncbi:hypothetical protein [Azorhizobium caulinodans]|uniref:hypothetical protein n=1 Tax=Azorhizobium caulinodans TaxID=7 RepID=UPI002FBEAACF
MRYVNTAALALLASLTFAGAASADEYLTRSVRENYAVSAQGFIPGVTAPAANTARSAEALLPAAAQATSAPKAGFQILNIQGQLNSPAVDQDPHWGPAQA